MSLKSRVTYEDGSIEEKNGIVLGPICILSYSSKNEKGSRVSQAEVLVNGEVMSTKPQTDHMCPHCRDYDTEIVFAIPTICLILFQLLSATSHYPMN